MSSRLCFCCLCKGEVVQSSYRKAKQHVALYGLWNSEAGPSTEKKSRANESDSDDSSSDLESEKDESAVIVEEDMCLVDEDMGEDSDDDRPTNDHEDQNDNNLVLLASDSANLAKVSLQVYTYECCAA